MNTTGQQDTAGGAVLVLATFILWGLTPLYFRTLHVVALTVEMLIVLPAAAIFLGVALLSGTATFGQGNRMLDVLLLLSGAVTAFPLLLFGRAVRGLRLSTLGVLQYIAPGLQFLLALTVFGEPFQPAHGVGFGCVWTALLLFVIDAGLARRRASLSAGTRPHARRSHQQIIRGKAGRKSAHCSCNSSSKPISVRVAGTAPPGGSTHLGRECVRCQ